MFTFKTKKFQNLGQIIPGEGEQVIEFEEFNQGDYETQSGFITASKIELNGYMLSPNDPVSPRTMTFFRDHKAKLSYSDSTVTMQGGKFTATELAAFIKQREEDNLSCLNAITKIEWKKDENGKNYGLKTTLEEKLKIEAQLDKFQFGYKSLELKTSRKDDPKKWLIAVQKINFEFFLKKISEENNSIREKLNSLTKGLTTNNWQKPKDKEVFWAEFTPSMREQLESSMKDYKDAYKITKKLNSDNFVIMLNKEVLENFLEKDEEKKQNKSNKVSG